MIAISKFLGTTECVKTTLLTTNQVVFVFTTKTFFLTILSVLSLKESFIFALKIGDKTCNFASLCRSPRQSQDDFKSFSENLELNLENFVQKNRF